MYNLVGPVMVKPDERDGFVLDDVIADLPKSGGTRGPVYVVVLVEPVAQYAAGGA